ncbi:MAG: RDD family protein [Chloroflexi bacterium]|nr:MAG: RDD family protein [Chloroflexota bacterium]
MAVATLVPGSPSGREVQARQVRRRRFGALILDLIFFSIVSLVVNNVYGVTVVTSGAPMAPGQAFAFYTTETTVGWPVLTLLWLAYYIVPEGLFGASLGKMACGLCVVRVDGRPLGIRSVFIRNLLRLIDVLPGFYLLGGLLVLGSAKSQRVGDRWAGTTVVAREAILADDPRTTRRPSQGTGRGLGIALGAAMLFTVAFNYFGRPPLLIEGMYNEHQLLDRGVIAYRLGAPQWGLGTVTYPIIAAERDKTCSGTITFNWLLFGWDGSQAQWSCTS